MNNIVKSVVFAAVVLFAGIAAMQVIYKNQDATSDITAVEPAAGEAATMTDGMPSDTQAQPIADAMTEDQADAAKDAVEANKDVAKDAIDAQEDAAKDAAENAKDAGAVTDAQADAAKEGAEADADAAKDAVDADAEAKKDAIEDAPKAE